MTVIEKSAPTITSFGIATTKGKMGGDAKQTETIITAIVSGWKHLIGANLMQELIEFAGGIARASAHLIVSWIDGGLVKETDTGKTGGGIASGGGGFATVMDFLFVMDGFRKQHNANLAREGMRKKTQPDPKKTAG